METKGIFLFDNSDIPDVITAWSAYERGKTYNNQLSLEDTVKVNENFFIGK